MPKTKQTAMVVVPDFTVADYETSAPYEWLMENGKDSFTLEQLVRQMKAKATAIGVKAFLKMWASYQKSLSQKGVRPPIENSVSLEQRNLELVTGPYTVSENGITILDRSGYPSTVCDHLIIPVRRLCNVDTGEERLELAYKRGNNIRFTVMEKDTLASSQKILELARQGVSVTSDNAKLLSAYLFSIESLNYETIPERKSVGRLGWIKDHGFSPYLEDLEFDGENNYKHIFGTVKQVGNRDKWVAAMRKVRAEKTVARIALAASFASVILEPCGLLPFFVHAWGVTGTGKSVLLMVAASVWGRPKIGDYVTTFNATNVGQEMIAGFLNSLPLCMDELQIQSSAGVKDFDKIIYQLTEGVGKTRGAKSGGLQAQKTWRNCIITNGEHPISNSNSGGGAVNRIIEFEVVEKVYSDLVKLCRTVEANYGWAGRDFVDWLRQEGNEDKIVEIQKDYYQQLLQSDSTEKQALSASAILAADQIVTELIFQDGNALTISDMAEVLTSKSQVDQNQRALEYLYELVATNPVHFEPDDFGKYKSEVWGKVEPDRAYIIRSIFDREMRNAGFSAASFLSWAKRKDLIESDSADKRRTKKTRVGGKLINTVCLKLIDEAEYDWATDDGDIEQLPL